MPAKSESGRRFFYERSNAMFDYLFAAAAAATIAGFFLEVWRELRKRTPSDDKGRKRKGQS